MRHYKVKQTSVQGLSIFILVALLSILVVPKTALSEDFTVAPNQTYTPQQVISIVVDSLQKNAADDQGIATVFRFASPGNKTATGPLSRFTQMIKRGYPDMLNHVGVRYDAIDITGDMAIQAVWLQTQSGAEYGYAFQLRKQRGGLHDGMWMTDAVVPLGKNKNSGIRI
jgi:hypothetical protein